MDKYKLFEGKFFGMNDKNGVPILEGDCVRFYHRGSFVECRVVYSSECGMFCLMWPDGYVNKFPLNPKNYEVVK